MAAPVADAIGRTVIGIDSSPAMLEQARDRRRPRPAARRHPRLELDEPAGLIYCPFRSLFHVPTWFDRRRVFERVTRTRDGGRFAWNAFAFDHAIAARSDGLHQDEPDSHTLRYSVVDNRIDIVLDSGHELTLVGDEERVARADRRCGPRGGSAVRRLRAGPLTDESAST